MPDGMCVSSTGVKNRIKSKTKLGVAWLVWGFAATFYFSDYMARVALSVMHRDLQLDFGMNETQFGILSASFYIPYVVMQIPVGLMVDRMSIRWTLTVMSLLTACGCCIFGLANGLVMASLGRMLIGFTAAFAFISTLRLATSWFPPTMMGLLAGLTQAVGMLGAASGQAPISFLVGGIGWRHAMFVIALLFVVLAGFLYQYVRDNPIKPCGTPVQKPQALGVFASLRIVLFMPQTWINALYAGFLFAPTAVIGEALGAAYLEFGRGLNAHKAAFTVGLIFLGWGLGGPLSGWLSDRIGRRKPIMIASAVCGLILVSWMVFAPTLGKTTAYVVFFIFGLTNTGVAIAYAVSTELHHRTVVGITIAFTNMMAIFVGAALQPLTGYFIDRAAGPRAYDLEQVLLSDFQVGLQMLPVCSLIALLLSFMVKETYCNPLKHMK
jgi:sugar phosphate permease